LLLLLTLCSLDACPSQDYLKTVVLSQLLAERGANIVVINLGVSPHINRSPRLIDVHLSSPFCFDVSRLFRSNLGTQHALDPNYVKS
jgi:hypothetical protein